MIHLIIAKGERQGEEISIPETGMRVGRAPANDLVVDDGQLSQFHCRFFFKSDGGLWVTDFGSTNQTLVNGAAVTEQRLHRGDLVDVGGLVLRVVHEVIGPDAERPADGSLLPVPAETGRTGQGTGSAPASSTSAVDLGFGTPARAPRASSSMKDRVLRLAWAAAVVLLILVGGWIAMNYAGRDTPARAGTGSRETPPLAIYFEKVEGNPENIFRYAVRLEDNELSVQIDDLKNARNVSREKAVNAEVVARLTRDLDDTEFARLDEEYTGVTPDTYDLWDMTIVVGPVARRVRVLNRTEPAEFKRVREIVEEFVRTEVGIVGLAQSPERLIELARDAFLMGRTRYEQRDIRYGNLADSVRQFTLAQVYLESIEPKPDFYPEVIRGLERSRSAMSERFENFIFRAERAIRLRDWQDAAQNLRVILEMIPDRQDERHQRAERQLLTVERHLQ